MISCLSAKYIVEQYLISCEILVCNSVETQLVGFSRHWMESTVEYVQRFAPSIMEDCIFARSLVEWCYATRNATWGQILLRCYKISASGKYNAPLNTIIKPGTFCYTKKLFYSALSQQVHLVLFYSQCIHWPLKCFLLIK